MSTRSGAEPDALIEEATVDTYDEIEDRLPDGGTVADRFVTGRTALSEADRQAVLG